MESDNASESAPTNDRLHVFFEYADAYGNTKIHDFTEKIAKVKGRVRDLVADARMDSSHQANLLVRVNTNDELFPGFIFLEPNPSRRVCLMISYCRDETRRICGGFHG